MSSKMSPSRTSLRQRLGRLRDGAVHRFATACGGMAAVEFALIAPVMVTLYFGVTELSNAYDANTKATTVASTAADLIAQEKSVCDPEMADSFTALNAIMYPFPPNAMKVRISSLIDNGNGTVKVAWSDTNDPTNYPARTVNTAVTIPAGLVPTGGSVIMSEVIYTYNSPAPHFFPAAVPMSDTYYLHPRKTSQIARTVACT
jgi:Flp pilus assembly protein TadG